MSSTSVSQRMPAVHPVVRANYWGRILSHFLGTIIVASVWWGRTDYLAWTLLAIFGLLWPHLAYYWARQNTHQKRAENRNLFIDIFCVGILIVSIEFQPWPTTFIFLVAVSLMTTGGIGLFLRGLVFLALGLLAGLAIMGFQLEIQSNIPTIAAASAGIAFFSMMSSFLTYRLTRKVVRMRKEMREKKEQIEGLASKLAKYLSPQVYGSIFAGERDVKIETSRKKLSIFFSDIKDFTAITDSMESEDLTNLLNNYFNEMSDIALKYGGTIDKFIGDAIMIFFGDPETKGEKEDAIACAKMALEMRDRMNSLQEKWESYGIIQPLEVRMGINTGFCTVGNFGSEDRMDYTIIGTHVNLASRLESNAEPDQILISQETYTYIKDEIDCAKKGEIVVKGFPHPIQTYLMIDLMENVDKSKYWIKQESDGFVFSADLKKVDKNEVKRKLQQIMAGLD